MKIRMIVLLEVLLLIFVGCTGNYKEKSINSDSAKQRVPMDKIGESNQLDQVKDEKLKQMLVHLPDKLPDKSNNYTLSIDLSSFSVETNPQEYRMTLNKRPKYVKQGEIKDETLTFSRIPSVSKASLQTFSFENAGPFLLHTNPTLKSKQRVYLAIENGMSAIFYLKDSEGSALMNNVEDIYSNWELNLGKWYTLMLECGACQENTVKYFRFKIEPDH